MQDMKSKEVRKLKHTRLVSYIGEPCDQAQQTNQLHLKLEIWNTQYWVALACFCMALYNREKKVGTYITFELVLPIWGEQTRGDF
jgi:hypothetical protein